MKTNKTPRCWLVSVIVKIEMNKFTKPWHKALQITIKVLLIIKRSILLERVFRNKRWKWNRTTLSEIEETSNTNSINLCLNNCFLSEKCAPEAVSLGAPRFVNSLLLSCEGCPFCVEHLLNLFPQNDTKLNLKCRPKWWHFCQKRDMQYNQQKHSKHALKLMPLDTRKRRDRIRELQKHWNQKCEQAPYIIENMQNIVQISEK